MEKRPKLRRAPVVPIEPDPVAQEVVSAGPSQRRSEKVRILVDGKAVYGKYRLTLVKGTTMSLPDEIAKWLIATNRAI